jgi:predicted CopG family antitoxin
MFKFLKKNKSKSSFSLIIEEYIKQKQAQPLKTFVIVKYSKQDKTIQFKVCELKDSIVTIDKIAYFVSENNLYTFDEVINKIKHKVVLVDVYEGITTGYSPFEDRLLEIYNERVQKAIYLYLMTGIMENKLNKKISTRQMIIAGLIGIAAIFIIIKMFA